MRHTPRHVAATPPAAASEAPARPPGTPDAGAPAQGRPQATARPGGNPRETTPTAGDGQPHPPGEDEARQDAAPLIDHLAVIAFLYLAGAAVVAAALLVPSWPGAERPWLWGLVAAAGAVGVALLLARHHLTPGRGALAALVALGTTFISAGALAAGPEGAAIVAVLYVLPAGYAAWALPWSWALALIAYGGVALGLVLWLLQPPWAAAEWVLVTGTAAVAALFVSKLARQAHARVRLERNLASALEEAETARTTLLRAARHDLGAPLTAVVGLLETLRTRLEEFPVERQRELLDRALTNAERLARIVDDLADHAGASGGQLTLRREPVDVAALVRDLADSVTLGARSLEVDADPVTVSVDPARVERIVQNLLVNAATHTPDGAAITVRVVPRRGGVDVAVEDTGPGVPDGRKQAIFEPFERGVASEDQAPGSGLGLAVVRQFARAHGGDAWVEDRPGGGARFVVRLPDDGR